MRVLLLEVLDTFALKIVKFIVQSSISNRVNSFLRNIIQNILRLSITPFVVKKQDGCRRRYEVLRGGFCSGQN